MPAEFWLGVTLGALAVYAVRAILEYSEENKPNE